MLDETGTRKAYFCTLFRKQQKGMPKRKMVTVTPPHDGVVGSRAEHATSPTADAVTLQMGQSPLAEMREVCATQEQRIAELLGQTSRLVEEKRLLNDLATRTSAEHERRHAILAEKYEDRGEELEAMLQRSYASGSASSSTCQWIVRQATEDKGLETLLNHLGSDGWSVQYIYEPRGGAYRVIAWKRGGSAVS